MYTLVRHLRLHKDRRVNSPEFKQSDSVSSVSETYLSTFPRRLLSEKPRRYLGEPRTLSLYVQRGTVFLIRHRSILGLGHTHDIPVDTRDTVVRLPHPRWSPRTLVTRDPSRKWEWSCVDKVTLHL